MPGIFFWLHRIAVDGSKTHYARMPRALLHMRAELVSFCTNSPPIQAPQSF